MACVIVIAALVDVPCSAVVVPLRELVSVMFPPDTAPADRIIDDLAPTTVLVIAVEYPRFVPATLVFRMRCVTDPAVPVLIMLCECRISIAGAIISAGMVTVMPAVATASCVSLAVPVTASQSAAAA